MKNRSPPMKTWLLWLAIAVLAGWCVSLESRLSSEHSFAESVGGTDPDDQKKLDSLEDRVSAIENALGARRPHR